MKNLFILLIVIFFFTSCEKEANEIDTEYPRWYKLCFEFLDAEGNRIPDNNIEMSQKMIMNNNRLEVFRWRLDQPEPPQYWFQMGVITQTIPTFLMEIIDRSEKILYGFSFEGEPFQERVYSSSDRYNRVKEGTDFPVQDWYYLFRNAENHSQVDTLRIQDVIVHEENYNHTFNFFWNGRAVEYYELYADGDFFGYLSELEIKE